MMKKSRRSFIRESAIIGSLGFPGTYSLLDTDAGKMENPPAGKYMTLEKPENGIYYEPLERINIQITEIEKGTIRVFDGKGQPYHQDDIRGRLNFKPGGSLGYHWILAFDHRDNLVDQIQFPVNCKTGLKDEDGEFQDMMKMLEWSVFKTSSGMGKTVRYNEKYYTHYSGWFQDSMYAVTRAMKYFIPDITGAIDLYGDGQRDDGMIFDNYKHPYTENQSYWEYRFDYGGFVYRPEDPLSSCLFVKVPAENIGQYTFIEGLFYTWKAIGDNEWLKKHIDRAIRAVEFTLNSEYYWSTRYQLLKRPFTVDIWDFQPKEDAAISGNDIMGYIPGKTRTGIHFGDNIAFSNACFQLAEMLDYLDRKEEAEGMRETGMKIRERINDLAWNGDFFLHHIPEDPATKRDLGVDQSRQISLSNALALNRGLDHNKCVSIVKTYEYLQQQIPESSPGEWYTIYPPFGEAETGWPKWQYMNGGVTPIVAGELARGAFEHGFEKYGVSILRRVNQLAGLKDNSLKGCYRGAMPEKPERNFQVIDLADLMNADRRAGAKGNVPGWIGSGIDDFRNLPSGNTTHHDIPFDLIDPEENGNRACLVISGQESFRPSARVEVESMASSVYFLHTATNGPVAGLIRLTYEDNTEYIHYVTPHRGKDAGDIAHWWYPTLQPVKGSIPSSVIWWRGPAAEVRDVGLVCFGLNNPFPEKKIRNISLENPDQNTRWAVFGITLSDHPVFFMPDIESTIPDHWASAHVMYGLIEGLVGIQDEGVAMDQVRIVPRWEAAGIRDVEATIKYEASGGYVHYRYKYILAEEKLILEFTGNADMVKVSMLIPDNKQLRGVYCDREICKYDLEEVEESAYAVFRVDGVGCHIVELRFS